MQELHTIDSDSAALTESELVELHAQVQADSRPPRPVNFRLFIPRAVDPEVSFWLAGFQARQDKKLTKLAK